MFDHSFMYVCVCVSVSDLGLLQWDLCVLSVDHTEGDALGLGGEHPGDGGTRVAHGDGDGAVTAGLDEELSGVVPEPCDVIHRKGDREPRTEDTNQEMNTVQAG